MNRSLAVIDNKAMSEVAHVAAHLVRAMALFKLDRIEAAGVALADAKAIQLPKEDHSKWNDLLVCQILGREAEALLGAKK